MEGIYLSGKGDIDCKEKIAVIENDSIYSQLHYHEFVELVYFNKGSGIHYINGEEYRVSNSDIYIINPYVKHEFKADVENPLQVINIMFYVDFFDKHFHGHNFIDYAFSRLIFNENVQNKNVGYIHIKGEHKQKLGELFKKMLVEFKEKDLGYLSVLNKQLSTLLIYIFRENFANYGKTGLTIQQKRRIEDALEYIEKNYNKNINVGSVAKNSGFCNLYFNTLFKKYVGVSIPVYIKNKRIEAACMLLATTDKKVEDICYEVGYSDIPYFYRIFQEMKKESPGEYRKKSEH